MATIKQRKIAKLIIENTTAAVPLNGGQMLESVGYAIGLQKQPGRILESEGVKSALEKAGFSEDNAKKVVAEIMMNEEADNSSRLKATDQVFKIHGTYAPEKRQSLNVNVDAEVSDDKLKSIREKFLAELKGELANGNI